jgi:CBS domain-containing protein
LVKHKYTGAPVIDAGDRLVGQISRIDVPRAIAELF